MYFIRISFRLHHFIITTSLWLLSGIIPNLLLHLLGIQIVCKWKLLVSSVLVGSSRVSTILARVSCNFFIICNCQVFRKTRVWKEKLFHANWLFTYSTSKFDNPADKMIMIDLHHLEKSSVWKDKTICACRISTLHTY